MGVAGRLAAAEACERRIHVYLEQPKLLFGPMTTGRGISSCGDGDKQGTTQGYGGVKNGHGGPCPGPEAGWFHVVPSRDSLVRKDGQILG